MLLYSTMIDIDKSMTKDAFVSLVIEWNQGSPHEENIIKDISWNGKNARFGDDKLWLEIIEYRNENIIAVRYEKISDDGVIWDTDYIMNFNEMRLAVRLERGYLEDAVVTNARFSTPHFITLLIEKGYVCPDADLEVSRYELKIKRQNVPMLASIIIGDAQYQLPIVYVSKTADNQDPVDIGKLCSRLKGAAHVLVQQDKKTNSAIRKLCDDQNEFNGAIGVYYPNDILGHKRCMYREGMEKHLLEKVVRYVLQYGTLQKPNKLYTWQGVNNSLLSDRLKSQKSERLEAEHALVIAENARDKAESDRDKARNEVEDVYASVDEEINELKKRVDELTRANAILDYENRFMQEKLAQIDEKPIIIQGEEEELCGGEIKDIVLGAVEDALSNANPGSRREHVLKDVLESNNFERLLEERRREVKRLLRGYKNMSASLRNNLKKMGFTITEEGKHYKLLLNDDPRYMVTLSKTASDHREGDNAASDICRIMF